MNVYVFGNEYLAEDSLARSVADNLSDVEVVHCRSPDDLLMVQDDPITILDVAKDAPGVRVITDIDSLRTRSIVSMHDFDIGYFLTLMDRIGQPKNVRIIAIPQSGDPVAIAEEVVACL